MLRPEEFGAVGDGERDDTAALRAALNRAEGAGVRLRARPYAIRDTLYVPTNAVLEGRGAVIVQKTDNKPILASLAWAGRGPTKGYTRILGLRCRAPAAASGRTGSSSMTTGPRSPTWRWSTQADVASCSPSRTSTAAVPLRRLSRTASATRSSAMPAAAPSSSARRRTAN
jgi:hypothetical protein